jgi:uncharacterized protein YndB with AHSA1/START domain
MAERRSSPVEDTSAREIVITRVFDAPREVVWNAWTDPEQVVQWWGPRGFTTTIHEMDVRHGGVWRHTMRGPDGTEYPNKSVFIEVLKPERIVYSHAGGRKGDPGAQFESTWTFEAQGNKTKLTLRMVFPSAAARDLIVKTYNAIEGGNQTLDRLGERLAKVTAGVSEFMISRVFDAPRELMWKAFTDPKHMKNWWGPKGFTVQAAKMDFRPGGSYHYCVRSPDGHDMWGKFVYREIAAPERIVFINSFSDEAGGLIRHPMSPTWPLEMLSTFAFSEQQGKTTLTIRWSPYNATEEERKTFEDGRKGMHQGWSGMFEQLENYLAKVQA